MFASGVQKVQPLVLWVQTLALRVKSFGQDVQPLVLRVKSFGQDVQPFGRKVEPLTLKMKKDVLPEWVLEKEEILRFIFLSAPSWSYCLSGKSFFAYS